MCACLTQNRSSVSFTLSTVKPCVHVWLRIDRVSVSLYQLLSHVCMFDSESLECQFHSFNCWVMCACLTQNRSSVSFTLSTVESCVHVWLRIARVSVSLYQLLSHMCMFDSESLECQFHSINCWVMGVCLNQNRSSVSFTLSTVESCVHVWLRVARVSISL